MALRRSKSTTHPCCWCVRSAHTAANHLAVGLVLSNCQPSVAKPFRLPAARTWNVHCLIMSFCGIHPLVPASSEDLSVPTIFLLLPSVERVSPQMREAGLQRTYCATKLRTSLLLAMNSCFLRLTVIVCIYFSSFCLNDRASVTPFCPDHTTKHW